MSTVKLWFIAEKHIENQWVYEYKGEKDLTHVCKHSQKSAVKSAG